jgi:hypothetical protein
MMFERLPSAFSAHPSACILYAILVVVVVAVVVVVVVVAVVVVVVVVVIVCLFFRCCCHRVLSWLLFSLAVHSAQVRFQAV